MPGRPDGSRNHSYSVLKNLVIIFGLCKNIFMGLAGYFVEKVRHENIE